MNSLADFPLLIISKSIDRQFEITGAAVQDFVIVTFLFVAFFVDALL